MYFTNESYRAAWKSADRIDPPIPLVRCYICKFSKSLSEFHFHRSRPNGHRAECRTCTSSNNQAYRKTRPTEYFSGLWKAYYAENKKRLNADFRAWQKANPRKIAIYNKQARARRSNAEGQFTERDIRVLWISQKGLCYYCSKPLKKTTLEHKTPLARGGSNWPSNLALACVHCNCSKRHKTEEEYRAIIRN